VDITLPNKTQLICMALIYDVLGG